LSKLGKRLDAEDRRLMRSALGQAEKGVGRASPNPTVGCVIVQRGEIVGMGWHDYDRLDHAEVCAIRSAGTRAHGATAYITLEPCSHQGRTPSCARLLIEAGIRRAVISMIDPNPCVSGRGVDLLRKAGIEVQVGLLRDRAAALIEPFACHITTGKPLVVAKAAMSLDGKIAAAGRRDRWITSPEARQFAQRLRFRMDAILVGIRTVLADNPELTYRGSRLRSRGLIRVILDSSLRIPPSALLFEAVAENPLFIFCSPEAAESRRRRLEHSGAEVIRIPSRKGRLDLNRVLEELGKRNVLGLLVEGGSEVHWSFLSAGLIDKFYFIVAPLVLGGRNAIPCVGGKGYQTIAEAARFKIRRRFTAGPDLVLEAYPRDSRSILSPWLP